ncbi:MAG: 1-acyl-sn-glycerol-3-phosphate acyltransferase [Actinomycetota bacterium]|nr:1-acyl-sn-glycerol-3-phosphate acyltransferase [Actinomycetota bacterium]
MTDLTYRIVNRIFRAMFRVLGLRIDVVGAHHIPATGPAVIACNHTGFLDFPFVGLAAAHQARLVRFMAKRSVFDNRLAGPLMRRMGHIRVDRTCGAVAYRQAERAVRRGEVVGVFPEATISRAWTLKPFKLGAATLAVKEGVPLVPVIVWGAHRILTTDGHRARHRGIAVTVLVGEPIEAGAGDGIAGAGVAQVDAELRRRMQDLLDEAQLGYPAKPRDAEGAWWLPAHLGGSAPSPEVAAELDTRGVDRVDGRR